MLYIKHNNKANTLQMRRTPELHSRACVRESDRGLMNVKIVCLYYCIQKEKHLTNRTIHQSEWNEIDLAHQADGIN